MGPARQSTNTLFTNTYRPRQHRRPFADGAASEKINFCGIVQAWILYSTRGVMMELFGQHTQRWKDHALLHSQGEGTA